jgi:hypothetical protein
VVIPAVGYFLTILAVLLAFALVVFAGYGKARAARRRAQRQIR